jgi:3',5'-cyclic AMP phosphodiesterase CpdA
MARFTAPVWSVPGNHENFGIERHLSKVSPEHPLYGKKMYRHFLGPNYYSFDRGGVHFVGLDTVDVDDLWYYGHVDETQLGWLEGDLAQVPPGKPVVTFNHIPFFSASETIRGYTEEPPAPTLIQVAGTTRFRHTVSNAAAVLAVLRGHPHPLALAGHIHAREKLELELAGTPTRFHQAAAVVGPSRGAGLEMRSGVVLYRLREGQIDDGRFIALDEGGEKRR